MNMNAMFPQISQYLKQYGIDNNLVMIGGGILMVAFSVLSSFLRGKQASNTMEKIDVKSTDNNTSKNDMKIRNEQYNANLTALLAAEDSKKNKKKKNKNKNKKKQQGTQAGFVSSLSAQGMGDDGDIEDSDDEDVVITVGRPKKNNKNRKESSKDEKVKEIVQKEVKQEVVVVQVAGEKVEKNKENPIVENTSNKNSITNDKKKKMKKNKNDSTTTTTENTTTSTVPATTAKNHANTGGNARETEQERAARLERMKARSAEEAKKDVPSSSSSNNNSSNNKVAVEEDEGWSIAGDRSKKMKTVEPEKEIVETPVVESIPNDDAVNDVTSIDDANVKIEEVAIVATPVAPPVPPAPVEITKTVTVDSRKIGRIIGPKGKTMKEIMAATNVKIDIPRIEERTNSNKNNNTVDITVVGSKNGTKKAISAIEELCTKGYAKLIAEEGFQESTITVSPSTQQELVSSGGKCLQTLQTQCNVRLNLNLNDNKNKNNNNSNNRKESAKLVIAGTQEGVAMCKEVINSIAKVFHHEMTHPGMIHSEVDVPEHMYKIIIGKKGSEIKHIQANFKVNVHIPQPTTTITPLEGEVQSSSRVLVIGHPNGVQSAVRYIEKIVEKAVAREQGIDDIIDEEENNNNNNNTITSALPTTQTTQDDVQPEWMDRFDYAKLRAREDAQFLAAAKELNEQEQRTGTQAPIQSQNTTQNQTPTDNINSIGSGAMPTPQEAWGLVGTTF